MPRYIVERSFADGLEIPADEQGAQRNGLPVDRITEVRVLDPYLHR